MNEPLEDGSGTSATAPRRSVRIPIWLKILAALVVPLIVVAALAWLQVRQAADEVERVDRETDLASVAITPGGLGDALIVERGDAIVTMLGIRHTVTFPTEDFAQSTTETDAAIATLADAVTSGGSAAEDAYADALERLDIDINRIRESVVAGSAEPGLANWNQAMAAYDGYSLVIGTLTGANNALVGKITDPGLRAAAATLDDVNRAHDAQSNLGLSVGQNIMAAGDPTARDRVAVAIARFVETRDSLRARDDGAWAPAVRAYQTDNRYLQLELQANDYLATEVIDLEEFLALNPGVTTTPPPMGTTNRIAYEAGNSLNAQVDSLRSDARSEQQRYTLLAIAVVLGAALLAAVMARSVTRPLRRLTAQAEEMATVKLPAAVKQVLETPPGDDVVIPDLPPIQVRSHDEVQSVAAALNDVQTSALDLAVEQATLRRNIADSFVSLGRRTQNLIGLQLEQITSLEEDEADPAVLESLYRLDHLATRARRNAESLVVLGGTEAQRAGGAPIRMTDVIRATLSEVEEYQRVDLIAVEEAMVPASSAADLIHLLAELTENGLVFSPPTSKVELRGEQTGIVYRITVEDRGVGMSDEKIREANIRLAGDENFTVAPSRYLGHYVAGRLAARVGAKASLQRREEGGIVATVDVPITLLLDLPAEALPGARPDATADAATAADRTEPSTSAAAPATTSGAAPKPAFDDFDHYKTDGRPPVAPSAPAATTSAGLRRRVPGQHVKPGQVTGPLIPRHDPSAVPAPPATPPAAAAPAGSPGEPPAQVAPSSPNLASLLTAYNSGVERGRQDAPVDDQPAADGRADGAHDRPDDRPGDSEEAVPPPAAAGDLGGDHAGDFGEEVRSAIESTRDRNGSDVAVPDTVPTADTSADARDRDEHGTDGAPNEATSNGTGSNGATSDADDDDDTGHDVTALSSDVFVGVAPHLDGPDPDAADELDELDPRRNALDPEHTS